MASEAREQLRSLPEEVRAQVLGVLRSLGEGEEPPAEPVQGADELVREGWKVTPAGRSEKTGLPFAVLFRILPGRSSGESNRVLIGGILPVSESKT
jgi:hypothetical protein